MAGPPIPVAFRLDVDGEGVVRVLDCSVPRLVVTPEDLGKLLTAVVKVIVSTGDSEDEVDVLLN